MATYIHGNLAARETAKQQERVRIKETRKVVVRAKTPTLQEKLFYLFAVAICVIVAGVVIWRFAQIYEMSTQIHQIQSDVKELQAENSVLKAKIDRMNSTDKLKDEAIKMGLVPKDEKQTVRIAGKSTPAGTKDSLLAQKP